MIPQYLLYRRLYRLRIHRSNVQSELNVEGKNLVTSSLLHKLCQHNNFLDIKDPDSNRSAMFVSPLYPGL